MPDGVIVALIAIHVIVTLAVVVYLLGLLGRWLGFGSAGFLDSDDIERGR